MTPVCKLPHAPGKWRGAQEFKWPSLQQAHVTATGAEFDGAHAFIQKVEHHRHENARLTFLANHVPKDATYTLTYGEMQSAGLVEREGPSASYEKSDRRS